MPSSIFAGFLKGTLALSTFTADPFQSIHTFNFTRPQRHETTMPSHFAQQIGVELHAACRQDDASATKALTTPNPPADWCTVLAIAAAEGATEVATYCLQQGARVDDRVLDHVICSDRSEPTYRFFVEAGHVSVDHSIESLGTMLSQAASSGRDLLVEYPLHKGANPNCRDQSLLLKPALPCAAGFANEKTLGLLLDHGARLNGSGALVFAAERGNIANVRFLLARGADVDEMGIENPADRRSLNKLGVRHPACRASRAMLMLPQTSLHKAVEAGHAEVAEILLAAGANDQLKDAHERTAADIDQTRTEGVLPASRRS